MPDPTKSADWNNRVLCKYEIANHTGQILTITYIPVDKDSPVTKVLNSKDSVKFYTVDDENVLSVWDKTVTPFVQEAEDYRKLIVFNDTIVIEKLFPLGKSLISETAKLDSGIWHYEQTRIRSIREKMNHPKIQRTNATLSLTISKADM